MTAPHHDGTEPHPATAQPVAQQAATSVTRGGIARLLVRAGVAGLVSATGVWLLAAAAVWAGQPTGFGAGQAAFLTAALVVAAFGGNVVAVSDFDVAGVAGSVEAHAESAPLALTLAGVYLLWFTTRGFLRDSRARILERAAFGIWSVGVFTASLCLPGLFITSDNSDLGATYLADYALEELGAQVEFSLQPSFLGSLLVGLAAVALLGVSLARPTSSPTTLPRWVVVASGVSAGVMRALALLPLVGAAAYVLLLFGDTQGSGLGPDAARAALVAAVLYAPSAALAFTSTLFGIDLVATGAVSWSATGRLAVSRATDYPALLEDEPGLYVFPVVVAVWAVLSWRATVRAVRSSGGSVGRHGRVAVAVSTAWAGIGVTLFSAVLWRLTTASATLTGRAERGETTYAVDGTATSSAQDTAGFVVLASTYIALWSYLLWRSKRGDETTPTMDDFHLDSRTEDAS